MHAAEQAVVRALAEMEPGQRTSFTGRTRRRKTSRAVPLGEYLSRSLITMGGIGTIIAVWPGVYVPRLGGLPLFLPARSRLAEKYAAAGRKPTPLLTRRWTNIS